jgi:hypothetical protein
LLFRRWPRLEIERIVSDITAVLTVTDNNSHVNIAEFRQLIGLVDESRLPSIEPLASSLGCFGSHNKGGLKIQRAETYGTLNIINSYI